MHYLDTKSRLWFLYIEWYLNPESGWLSLDYSTHPENFANLYCRKEKTTIPCAIQIFHLGYIACLVFSNYIFSTFHFACPAFSFCPFIHTVLNATYAQSVPLLSNSYSTAIPSDHPHILARDNSNWNADMNDKSMKLT